MRGEVWGALLAAIPQVVVAGEDEGEAVRVVYEYQLDVGPAPLLRGTGNE